MFSSLVSMLLMSGAKVDNRSLLAGQPELPSARRGAEHKRLLAEMRRDEKSRESAARERPGMVSRLRGRVMSD